MKKVTPFIWFDGEAEAAAQLYVSIFKNSRITKVSRWGGGPWAGQVMSVEFVLDGDAFIAFNGGPHYKLNPAFSMFVLCETQEEVDTVWEKLLEGGRPDRCGWLQDRFGLSWQVVPKGLQEALQHPDPERARKALEAMMQMVKLDIRAIQQA